MKKAYAVIGANFGDEGKGLMTDYFCRKNENVIDVRINGGAQAGHTVCTPDGKRHVFSHIGAGYFAGADTYLSEFFIVNPMLFNRESEQLGLKAGKVYIDKHCLLTLPCDMLLNQFAERNRGDKRHGSCGVGIYETMLRSADEKYRLEYGEVEDSYEYRTQLISKMQEISNIYCRKRADELKIKDDSLKELFELINNENIILNYIDELIYMSKLCCKSDVTVIDQYQTAVFEGAQGLLLDMDRDDYFPNLTPSNTGMKNIRSILDRIEKRDTEVCYVTRTYFTRHGAGRFDTEYPELQKKCGLIDKTNSPNEFQGYFRYGWFDLPEFMTSLSNDRKYALDDEKISIAVTHLDMTKGKILCQTGKLLPEDISYMTCADKLYKVYGETAANVEMCHVYEKALLRK